MIVERADIRLITLTEEYLELVREKRNLPEIQNTMEYREYITPQMQQKWFKSINNNDNLYFLVEVMHNFIGLISAVDIDWAHNTVNNGGIFIWNKNYWQSPEAVQASLLLTDFGYYLGIKKNYIRILKNNATAIAFNTALGYKLEPNQGDTYNQKYELDTQAYFQNTQRLRTLSSLRERIRVYISEKEYRERQVAKKIIDPSDAAQQNIGVDIHFTAL